MKLKPDRGTSAGTVGAAFGGFPDVGVRVADDGDGLDVDLRLVGGGVTDSFVDDDLLDVFVVTGPVVLDIGVGESDETLVPAVAAG